MLQKQQKKGLLKLTNIRNQVGFTQYPFFVHFYTFLLLHEKVCAFLLTFLYVHIRTNQTVTYWQKFFETILDTGFQPYFEILLTLFMHKILEQNFSQYVTVYLVWIRTYKNADKKVRTISWRNKNVKNVRKVDTALIMVTKFEIKALIIYEKGAWKLTKN